MGGYGSGRWGPRRQRRTLDAVPQMDVRVLYRAGGLQPGQPGTHGLPLAWSACNYGGLRPWFQCPQCGRRVAVLAWGGQGFLCRHCYRLPYGSQWDKALARGYRTVRKIRDKVGASHNLETPIGAKPPGMHWRTFARICAQEREAQQQVVQMLGAMLPWAREAGSAPGPVPTR